MTSGFGQSYKHEYSFGIATALVVIVPRLAPYVFIALAISFGLALRSRARFSELMRPAALPGWFWVALSLLVWSVGTALWSPVPLISSTKPLQCGVVVVSLLAMVRLSTTLTAEESVSIGRGLISGFLVGMTYLILEEVTAVGILRTMINNIDFLQGPSRRFVQVENGHVVSIDKTVLNRGVVVLGLFVWPALSYLALTAPNTWRRSAAPPALIAATFMTIFGSHHLSSKVGIVLGCAAFILAHFRPATARMGISAIWLAMTLLVVPAAELAGKSHLQDAAWLFPSARDRVFIWSFTAGEISKSPIGGVGAEATPFNNEQLGSKTSLQSRLGRHAHNIFLQTWYELGGVGALLLCTLGMVVIRSASPERSANTPFMLAQFATFLPIASFAFGMWQLWFIAVACMSAVYWSLLAPAAQPLDRRLSGS